MEEETSGKDGAMKTWDLRIVVKLLLDFRLGMCFIGMIFIFLYSTYQF